MGGGGGGGGGESGTPRTLHSPLGMHQCVGLLPNLTLLGGEGTVRVKFILPNNMHNTLGSAHCLNLDFTLWCPVHYPLI